MNQKITVALVPDAYQVQLLLENMNRYSELCNYISCIVNENKHVRPVNLYYWKADIHFENLYEEMRAKFPDINSNFIPIAFRRVGKAYKRSMPCNAHKFNGTVDYSKYLLSIKFILPPPQNMGVLNISTLAGREQMHFTFDDSCREGVYAAFNRKEYCEYKLTYQGDTFFLSTNIKNQMSR